MIRPQFTLDLNNELIVDNFAGGGGASTGIERALGRHVDLAINHDTEAVQMHEVNHPQTHHFTEDVFDVDPIKVTKGRPVGLAWFSPDCKHFSKAKGGQPRSKKIRGLAWVIIKWQAMTKFRVGMMENVEEFKTWGPLLKNGNPCPVNATRTFKAFIAILQDGIPADHPDIPEIRKVLGKNFPVEHLTKGLGGKVEMKELRACDYGAPTIRKRLFIIMRFDGKPIVWPEPTHADPKSEEVKKGKLKPWRTAAECINFSLPCPSIFLTPEEARILRVKRPLAEASMRRIAKGTWKYVINAKKPFIVTLNHQGEHFRGQGLEEPFKTVAAAHDAHGLVMPSVAPFITEHSNSSKQRNMAVTDPLRTQCAEVKGGHFAVVSPSLVVNTTGHTGGAADQPLKTVMAEGKHHAVALNFLTKYHGAKSPDESRGLTPDEPLHVQTTENRFGLVSANFIAKNYTGVVGADLEKPTPTVTCTDHNSLVAAHMVRPFGQSIGSPADTPAGTVTADGAGKVGVVATHLVNTANSKTTGRGKNAWPTEDPLRTITTAPGFAVAASHLMKMKGDNLGQDHREPAQTITASGQHFAEVRAFLIKYYGNEQDGVQCTDPMHTVTTKDRVGVVMVEGEEYQISDIGMRMLEPIELYAAQGFPKTYVIDLIITKKIKGKVVSKPITKKAQVRMVGNSVCPDMAEAMARANVPEMATWEKGEKAA